MVCKKCSKNIESGNFCPNCGTAISEIAVKIEKAKADAIKLKLIAEIVNKTADEKTLCLLKDMTNKISNN